MTKTSLIKGTTSLGSDRVHALHANFLFFYWFPQHTSGACEGGSPSHHPRKKKTFSCTILYLKNSKHCNIWTIGAPLQLPKHAIIVQCASFCLVVSPIFLQFWALELRFCSLNLETWFMMNMQCDFEVNLMEEWNVRNILTLGNQGEHGHRMAPFE